MLNIIYHEVANRLGAPCEFVCKRQSYSEGDLHIRWMEFPK